MVVSLLRNGPHAVTVTPKVKVRGDYGTRLEDGEPVRVERVRIQDFNASYETGTEGNTQVSADVVIYGTGAWPGGPHSTIRVESGGHAGKTFDQTGDIKHHDDVPHIKHWRVLASLRSTEAR